MGDSIESSEELQKDVRTGSDSESEKETEAICLNSSEKFISLIFYYFIMKHGLRLGGIERAILKKLLFYFGFLALFLIIDQKMNFSPVSKLVGNDKSSMLFSFYITLTEVFGMMLGFILALTIFLRQKIPYKMTDRDFIESVNDFYNHSSDLILSFIFSLVLMISGILGYLCGVPDRSWGGIYFDFSIVTLFFTLFFFWSLFLGIFLPDALKLQKDANELSFRNKYIRRELVGKLKSFCGNPEISFRPPEIRVWAEKWEIDGDTKIPLHIAAIHNNSNYTGKPSVIYVNITDFETRVHKKLCEDISRVFDGIDVSSIRIMGSPSEESI